MTSERGKDPRSTKDPRSGRVTNNVFERYTKWQGTTFFYKHHNERNAPEMSYVSMGLAGEAGETIDEVKKIVRECGQHDDDAFNRLIFDPKHHDKLIKELGDTLYYLNRMCKLLGLTMEQLAVSNCAKLCERHNTTNPFTPPTQE